MLWNVGLKVALYSYITTDIIQNTCFFRGSLQSNMVTSSMFVIRKLDFKNALLINIENKWHTVTMLSHFRIQYFYKQKDLQDGFASSLLWEALKPHNVPSTHQWQSLSSHHLSLQEVRHKQEEQSLTQSLFVTFKCCLFFFFFWYVEGPLFSHFRKAVSWLRLQSLGDRSLTVSFHHHLSQGTHPSETPSITFFPPVTNCLQLDLTNCGCTAMIYKRKGPGLKVAGALEKPSFTRAAWSKTWTWAGSRAFRKAT